MHAYSRLREVSMSNVAIDFLLRLLLLFKTKVGI
jgi:hypothetical protein